MILKTKPFTVGCGATLNLNVTNFRCGEASGRGTTGMRNQFTLCENCRVRQTANTIMELHKNARSS